MDADNSHIDQPQENRQVYVNKHLNMRLIDSLLSSAILEHSLIPSRKDFEEYFNQGEMSFLSNNLCPLEVAQSLSSKFD